MLKINVFDLVIISVLSAISSIIFLGFHFLSLLIPILIPLASTIASIIIAPIIILLCKKVSKSGVFFYSALIRCFFSFILQEIFTYIIVVLLFALLAELVAKIFTYNSPKGRVIGYICYSLGFSLANILPLFLIKDFYISLLLSHGLDAAKIVETTTIFTLVLTTLLSLIFSLIGAIWAEFKFKRYNVSFDLEKIAS